MTADEIAELHNGLRVTDDIRARRARGETLPSIAAALNTSVPTLWRWLKRREQADAGNTRALVRGRSTGR
ncbi:MAG: LysM peptidoglycan-binding domain-containing protein, partial [Verrucomicrobia bacterium]|nr:LysM peptidoglycan-binding domain-containing protein [Verrucomicrobiota bacterium]